MCRNEFGVRTMIRGLRHVGHLTIAICLTTSPVLAEEVLYCVDTAVTGFKWDKQKRPSVEHFNPRRFTVRIESETKRWITPTTVGDTGDVYECKQPFKSALEVVCTESSGSVSWFFRNNTYYTRAFLAGGPLPKPSAPPPLDPNIALAHGTCTKF